MVQLFASLEGSFPRGTSPVTLSEAQINKITWLYDKSTEVRAAINALLARITGGSVRLIEPKPGSQENDRLMTSQLKHLAKQVTVQFILYGMCAVLVPDDKSFPRVRSLGDFTIERAFDGASLPMYKLQLKTNPKEAEKAQLMLLVRDEPLTNGDLGSSFVSLVPDFQRLRVMKLSHYFGFIRRQTAPVGFQRKGADDAMANPGLPPAQASDANGAELNEEAKVKARVNAGPRRVNFRFKLPASGSKEDDDVERKLIEDMVNHEGYVPEVIVGAGDVPISIPVPPPAPELKEMREYFSSQTSMVFGLPSQLWDPSRMSEAVSESVTDSTAFHVMMLAQDVREALELLIRNYSLKELVARAQQEETNDSDDGSMGDDEEEPRTEGGRGGLQMKVIKEERGGAIPMDQESSSSEEEEEEPRPLKRKLPRVTVELIPQLPLSMALQLRETKELNDEGFRRIMQSQLGLDPKSLTSENDKVDNKTKLEGVEIQKKKLKLDETKTKGQLEQGEKKLELEKEKNQAEEESQSKDKPTVSSSSAKSKKKKKTKK